ncbi:DUF1304 domain-containing protein [Halobacteriovorax sp.]|uniref:DUF1304 domain-containing protein n=1 Tax=Halobacteriovorax sp. TaxID=2020862 RepID=UPI00356A1AE9
MILAAKIFTGAVALLHFYFLILEMFLWDKPKGLKIFGNTLEKAKISKGLAANQGLYNGFLGAGLLYGLYTDGNTSFEFIVFFLLCMIIAGCYGAISISRKIFFIQAAPALIALFLTFNFRSDLTSQIQNFIN